MPDNVALAANEPPTLPVVSTRKVLGANYQRARSNRYRGQDRAPRLRRIQFAPLWLPLPHHDDTFDPLYVISEDGDEDCDHRDEDECHDDGQGNEDDKPDSGNDCDGPEDDNIPTGGHNGGADKVATDADHSPEDHVANSPKAFLKTRLAQGRP